MEDDEKGKLFVGGLSWETTQENLQRYFVRYGEVIDCVVMKNNETGRSRGFGFVTFSDPANVNHVLQNGPHTLDGRTIDPKPCNPRTLQKPKRGGGYPKVFLGGLPSNVTETDLRHFFGRYGKVMEVVIMYDQEKKKSRGFGFLSFEEEASVERVCNEHYVNLNGKQVEIKKAEPRDGSGNNKMVTNNENSQWGPPQGAPAMQNMNMQGTNGQMNAPPMNMPMGTPNMMQAGYQNWGTSPQQQSYGYGQPSATNSYQNWGGPPQGPPQPWVSNNNYGAPQQTQGYGSYDMYNNTTGPAGPATSGSAANWNSWNMPPNSSSSGSAELYSRSQSGPSAPSQTGPNGLGPNGLAPALAGPTGIGPGSNKSATEYTGYSGGYGNYTNDQTATYGGPRGYANENSSQQIGYPPQGINGNLNCLKMNF
uniref:Putative rna-binding protein musashi/mrna cleavage and polyadenylation factor i complex n=1 Tax=Corethrella appendiculata TaxID=1370023 RepID=U5ENZ1_9DIPT